MKNSLRWDGSVSFAVDVHAAAAGQDRHRVGRARSGAAGDDCLPFLKLLLVEFCFVLADTEARERAKNSTDGHAGDRAAEKGGKNSTGNRGDWPDARQ